jgi:hypothetical protein
MASCSNGAQKGDDRSWAFLSYQKLRTGLLGIYDRISVMCARVFKNEHYTLYRGAFHVATNNVSR